MGIDKPNVRYVIHHSISKSMENYYQESGRAGRDGESARCIIFFRAADAFRQSTMVFTEHTGLQNIYTMLRYCLNEVDCRRLLIAKSFGEKWRESDCNSTCDICHEFGSVHPEGVASSSKQDTMLLSSVSKGDQPCKQQSVVSCQRFIEEDISEYTRALIELVEHAQENDKRLTAQKLLESWRGQGPVANRLSHIPTPKFSIAKCEAILLQAILDGILKEEFHFTPYSTISYVGLGRKAAAVKMGILIVSRRVRPSTPGSKGSSALEKVTVKAAVPVKGRLGSKAKMAAAKDSRESKDQSVVNKPKKRKLPQMYIDPSDSEGDDFVRSATRSKRVCERGNAYRHCSRSTDDVIIEIDSD